MIGFIIGFILGVLLSDEGVKGKYLKCYHLLKKKVVKTAKKRKGKK